MLLRLLRRRINLPLYVIKCSNEECDKFNITSEVRMSFEMLGITMCPSCGSKMIQEVSKVGFNIQGFCHKNGWEIEHMNYDGTKPDW
jgi:predicted nucleic acid-binding Zn ribbon protein